MICYCKAEFRMAESRKAKDGKDFYIYRFEDVKGVPFQLFSNYKYDVSRGSMCLVELDYNTFTGRMYLSSIEPLK